MSKPKSRRVHIMKPMAETPDETLTALEPGFWSVFHNKISGLEARAQFHEFLGLQYRGAARHCTGTSVDYMYLGKNRAKSDWPERGSGDDDEFPLVLEEADRLVEPCYLYDLGRDTNTVAVLRSSGGPSISAVESWMTRTFKHQLGNKKLRLQPVTREDQMERLENALAVSKFEVSLMASKQIPEDVGNMGIELALHQAYLDAGHSATIDFKLSFGNSLKAAISNDSNIADFRNIFSWGIAKKATATLVFEEEDGSLRRELVDFISDKVSFQINVGDDANMAQTPEVVTAALIEAKSLYNALDL
jgi:hypothetical protein